MLESMIKNPRPTRAEVSDVANAIYDSTSAVMLSGETAVGAYPIETVKMMKSIIEEAESNFNYADYFYRDTRADYHDISSSIALASVKTAYSAKAAAIFAFTTSGYTARLTSRFRPEMPILALASTEKVYHQMAFNWGVIPVPPREVKNVQEAVLAVSCFAMKRNLVHYGDLVVVTAGSPFGISGTTNAMIVESIGDVLVRGIPSSGAKIHAKVAILLTSDEHVVVPAGRIVVVSRCDQSYEPFLKQAVALVLQNHPDDIDSEKEALVLARKLGIPLLQRADGALGLLTDGMAVTFDPSRGLLYRGSIGSDEEMLPSLCK
jgi:pyruvate kinase